jgi:small-conductance mechanosensitive channel
MSFQDTLLSWHDFYLACAAASATFAGLLFVGISLHLRIIVTHPEARSLARVTLSDYFVVLLVSLVLLTPAGVPQQLGIEMIGIAAVSLALITPTSVRGIRARRARTLGLRLLISRFGLSMLGYIALGILGLLFYLGSTPALFAQLVWIVLVLLIVAVRNTWDLLVTIADKSSSGH